jgi:eukaryotic-like serine/threonine-protein kinase
MRSPLLHPKGGLIQSTEAFQPGQKIEDDRFEIVRKIGEGTKGIVYEALDRKRHQRVALKFARSSFAELLSPEFEGALKVRHPNICLVNQIHTTRLEGQKVDFLAMEYIDGESLSSYLSSHGRLSKKEALETARQLCTALSEAHRNGVIHRDLKPGNVMLGRIAKGGSRAFIMDLGLTGGLPFNLAAVGVTSYMAPEVREGKQASCASDIYSLGVILYECVTGRKPGEKGLQDPPDPGPYLPPTALNEELDPRWDRAILPCLAISPTARPTDALHIIADLEKKPFSKAPFWAVAFILAAILAIPQVHQKLHNYFWPPANVRLAILPLEETTGGLEVGRGALQDVSDRVRRMRSGGRTVVVISPSEVVAKHVYTPSQARDVLHATHALQTTIVRDGQDYTTQGTVIDLGAGTSLQEFSGRYSRDTIGSMPAALASGVSIALRLQGPTTPDSLSAAATPSYDQGLFALRKDRVSFEPAITAFENAARLDPRSALPLAGLVEANIMKFDVTHQQSNLDDASRALKAAESLNPDSPRVRLAAGLLKEIESQYEKALDDYRKVKEQEPRSVEATLRIARVYDKLGMPSQAIKTYQEAIDLDPAYYGGYHGLGVFYFYRGNYKEAAEQFQKSIERAPGLSDEYANLGAVLEELGRDSEAETALLTSLKLRESPDALNNIGAMRAYQKRDEEAVSYYKRAVALDPSNYILSENLGDSYRRLGRMSDAKAAYRQAMNLAMTMLKENPRLGYPRGHVAYFSARLGDRKRAEDEIEEALRLSPGETKVIRSAVLTYVALGDSDRAIQVLNSATPELIKELDRQPDLAEFRQDSRFRELVAKNSDERK